MKVCFFVSDATKIGGIERVTSILTSRLCEYQGLEIEIVSLFRGRKEPHYSFQCKIVYLVENKHGIKPHSLKRAIKMLKQITSVRNYFRSVKYDFVVAQSFPMALMMFLSGYPLNKIIAVEHVYAGYYNKLIQLVRQYIYRNIYQVVVLTRADQKYLSRFVPKDKITIIPNPFRDKITIKSNLTNKRIISIGRLEYQKGFDNLIIAFNEVYKKHNDWELDIYGEGSLRVDLQEMIDRYGLSHSVFLRGTTTSIDEEICKSSIFVMSSRFEGFGMVLVEALSHGVPCISFDCPNGPSDIVMNDVNGFLIENQNIQALSDAIEKLICDEQLRCALGVNGPKTISKYNDEQIARKWLDLLFRNK